MITENGGLPPTVNPGTGTSGPMFGRTSGVPTLASGTAQLPFSAKLLESGKVHEVINSNDILGVCGTFTTLSATAKFHAEQPKSTTSGNQTSRA
jgi:hypothetical protein